MIRALCHPSSNPSQQLGDPWDLGDDTDDHCLSLRYGPLQVFVYLWYIPD